MHPQPAPDYLSGYPPALTTEVHRLIQGGQLAGRLLAKYPVAHGVRSDRALFDYVQEIKDSHLRMAAQLSKVKFDGKLHVIRNALGTHSRISRVQGSKLTTRREIRIATVFVDMPEAFLRMIVVHELAHLKESGHDKAFYQLCRHMEPAYHQLEFDLRCYLSHLDVTGRRLWSATGADA